jgi:predicted  nucleic acid-binding Zn-ribbon protein
MSNVDELNRLETFITAAKAEVSKAEGAIAQLEAQAEKEFGVKSLEEAKALEESLEDEVAELSKKFEDALAKLKADYAGATA